MKRPRTTSLVGPSPDPVLPSESQEPTKPTWRELAPVVAALIAALEIVETSPRSGPAIKAHRSTVRQQGESASAIGGPEAMQAALRQVAEADPARAEARTQFVYEAWTGLPEWRA